MKLSDLKAALLSVSPNVFHYMAFEQPPPYIVYAEEGTTGRSLLADDKLAERAITATVDLFTMHEDDPLFGKIEDALRGIDCGWRWNSVQYEDVTKYIHHEWVVVYAETR